MSKSQEVSTMTSAGSSNGAPGGEAAWLTHLPVLIRSLWEEVYQALRVGSFTLVAHGTRTLVERLAQDLIGDAGSFAQTLRALHEHGIISRREWERLTVAVEVGHAVVHRQLNVGQKEASALVHIIEAVLRNAYLPEADVDSLRSIIPPRS
jgi:hypothetical protein